LSLLKGRSVCSGKLEKKIAYSKVLKKKEISLNKKISKNYLESRRNYLK
jgi:hypothetical protein